MELVIMAAGMGSRFGGLKQIEPINEDNEFIIDYSIFDAIRAGFDKIVFVIKEENYEIFRDTVGRRVEKQIPVEYVFQRLENVPSGFTVPEGRIKPWGTAHAILSCKEAVRNDFAIINADDFYGKESFEVVGKFLDGNHKENEFCLAGFKVKNTLTDNGAVKRGACKVEGNKLKSIIECSMEKNGEQIIATPLSGGEPIIVQPDDPVSMNIYGFSPIIFEYLEKRFKDFLETEVPKNPEKSEFLIPDIVAEMIEKGMATVTVLNTSAVWHGVTYKEDKPEVVNSIKALVEGGVYPKHLWG